MNKYEVTYGIVGSFTLGVEAESEEQAKEKADALIDSADDIKELPEIIDFNWETSSFRADDLFCPSVPGFEINEVKTNDPN